VWRWVEFWHFPFTCFVVFKTLSHYRASVWSLPMTLCVCLHSMVSFFRCLIWTSVPEITLIHEFSFIHNKRRGSSDTNGKQLIGQIDALLSTFRCSMFVTLTSHLTSCFLFRCQLKNKWISILKFTQYSDAGNYTMKVIKKSKNVNKNIYSWSQSKLEYAVNSR